TFFFDFCFFFFFFFSSRRRHTRSYGDWSSDVCSSDLGSITPRVLHGYNGHTGDSCLFTLELNQLAEIHLKKRIPVHNQEFRRVRSEERRVGKECKAREMSHALKTKETEEGEHAVRRFV